MEADADPSVSTHAPRAAASVAGRVERGKRDSWPFAGEGVGAGEKGEEVESFFFPADGVEVVGALAAAEDFGANREDTKGALCIGRKKSHNIQAREKHVRGIIH